MAWRIGVDIGGTFTDVALIDDASGRIGVAKVPTTPRDLAEGVLSALDSAMQRHGDRARRRRVCCRTPPPSSPTPSWRRRAPAPRWSPRAASATCWSCGARPAPTSTTCSRMRRPRSIPRRRRFEITERIGADGAVVTPLAEGEIDGLIAELKAARVQAVAVALLFSFLNPEHERRLGARLRAALPGIPIYLSWRCCPRSRSSSAPAPRRCAPTSARSWPRTWSGWRAPRAAKACRRST